MSGEQRMAAVGLVVSLVLAAETQLDAYLDPGAGSLIWQSLVAAMFGAGIFLRRLMRPFRFRKRKDNGTSAVDKSGKPSDPPSGSGL